jgi:hypothetical protein
MLTRELANQVSGEWQQANDMNASAIRQFEAMLRAALIVTKTQVQLANAGKGHWDYSGVAAKVLAAPGGAPVGDGQYDADYIRMVQAMWASYMTWLASPVKATVNGKDVTLPYRPLDIIMSAPQVAGKPLQDEQI